jgi:hypothetical protein
MEQISMTQPTGPGLKQGGTIKEPTAASPLVDQAQENVTVTGGDIVVSGPGLSGTNIPLSGVTYAVGLALNGQFAGLGANVVDQNQNIVPFVDRNGNPVNYFFAASDGFLASPNVDGTQVSALYVQVNTLTTGTADFSFTCTPV